MFTVHHKWDKSKTFTVYDIQYTMGEQPKFLIFDGVKWKLVYAEDYVPDQTPVPI